MRKVVALIITLLFCILLMSSNVFATNIDNESDGSEQIILKLLFNSANDAISEYYGEYRQFMNEKIIGIQKSPYSSSYDVVVM